MPDDALRAAYDRQADTYGTIRNHRYDAFRARMLDLFAERTRPIGRRVLDVGAGPGHEAQELQLRGLDPLAIDFSHGMAAACLRRGVPAAVTDLRAPGLAPHAFAGAWLSFSLLHLPKRDVPAALTAITAAVRPGGFVMVLLFEGSGEGPRTADVARFGTARWFSYYSADELTGLVGDRLTDLQVHRLDLSPRPTLVVAGHTTTRKAHHER